VCPDSVLMRHFFSAQRAVTVDECPTCGGVWLDAGELDRIRSEYPSDAARRQAAELALEEALVPDRLALMDAELQEQLSYDTSRSRVLSSLLVACYLAVAFMLSGTVLALKMLYFSTVPWACVCFPDAIRRCDQPDSRTTRESPRSFVWFFGWLALLLPLIQLRDHLGRDTGHGSLTCGHDTLAIRLMPRKKIDFNVVRAIAKALPGIEAGTIHGAPSLKVRGKLLTCPALHGRRAEYAGGSNRFRSARGVDRRGARRLLRDGALPALSNRARCGCRGSIGTPYESC